MNEGALADDALDQVAGGFHARSDLEVQRKIVPFDDPDVEREPLPENLVIVTNCGW